MSQEQSYHLDDRSQHSHGDEADSEARAFEGSPSHRRQWNLTWERARVLAACSFLQLPIWGMLLHGLK